MYLRQILTYSIIGFVTLLAFNNCSSDVKFDSLSSEGGSLSDLTANDDIIPPVSNVPPAVAGPPVAVIPPVYVDPRLPAAPEAPAPDVAYDDSDDDDDVIDDDLGGICSYKKFPLPYGKCTDQNENGEFKNTSYDSSKAELYIFAMYNSTNLSHAKHVLAPQGIPGDRYSTEMNVVVAPGSKDVILVLSAYEPTHWKISGVVSRVKKVILRGYHCQTAEGVSASLIEKSDYDTHKTSSYFERLPDARDHAIKYEKDFNASLVRAQYVYSGTCLNGAFTATQ